MRNRSGLNLLICEIGSVESLGWNHSHARQLSIKNEARCEIIKSWRD